MNKGKKWPFCLLACILSLSGVTSHATAEQYCTIADLREQTATGWHAAYEVNGETIVVDVDIEIPDVEKVAAVRVRWPEGLAPDFAPPGADIVQYEREGFAYSIESAPNTLFYPDGPGGSDRYYQPEAQAENSPLSPEEALAFAQELLAPYVQQAGGFEMELRYMDAWSRTHPIAHSDASGMTLDYSKTLTEMGYYNIYFTQVFHGVPYVRNTPPFVQPIDPNAMGRPWGDISVTVGSRADYSVVFCPAVEDCVVAEDLPLVPFSEVRREFERIIEAGYIRGVHRVRLEYVCLDNPDDLGNSFILVPVWELNGVLVQNPTHPTPVFSGEEMEKQRLFGGQEALVNAQTGTYYDPMDQSADRGIAKVLTWAEIH